MDLIKGLFGLVVIGFIIWIANAVFEIANSVFEFVGGWPGVIALLVCIAVFIFVVGICLSRRQEINELKEAPKQIQILKEEAHVYYREGVDLLERAKVEFEEERRAPLFWDAMYECNDALLECAYKLDQAQGKLTTTIVARQDSTWMLRDRLIQFLRLPLRTHRSFWIPCQCSPTARYLFRISRSCMNKGSRRRYFWMLKKNCSWTLHNLQERLVRL